MRAEQNTEKKEDLPALGGLGRPEEKAPIQRYPGIRGDADAPGRLGMGRVKTGCADDSYAEVKQLRKAPGRQVIPVPGDGPKSSSAETLRFAFRQCGPCRALASSLCVW